MSIRTTARGEPDLPRYFAMAFETVEKLRHGRIDIKLPDGRVFRAEGPEPGPVAVMEVHHPEVFTRLVREGDLGLCEAYMDGWWTTPDLQGFMDLVHAENEEIYDGFLGVTLVRAYERVRFWFHRNTRAQAKRNIAAHYDLGNDFYGLWLDDTMTYSSALFETGQEPTEAAQKRKYEALVDAMEVKPGEHVLEIGCGWGGFAEYAAGERGLKVTGLTISKEQAEYARARMERAGLSDRVEIRLQDYRDTSGQFDGIASIEMFEAVGQRYWPTYFNTLSDRLHAGRKAVLQIITVHDRRWDIYRKGIDFVQKYIFPGGMLPAPKVLRAEIEKAGLRFEGERTFGQSYDQTLRRWYDTFNGRWDEIAELGFDERFRRMWNLYLTACASSFRFGNCDVTQVAVARPA
ncbi:methyltransferase domain-containing protein [Rhodobacterales bacterium HKCCE2091]|nr:methyltransferase domain-containing protein [Rhodobacterales bacterium HKCCE2091]